MRKPVPHVKYHERCSSPHAGSSTCPGCDPDYWLDDDPYKQVGSSPVSAKPVYAVYFQFEPTYKYEPVLRSIWSTKERAGAEMQRLKVDEPHLDRLWVDELFLDSRHLGCSEEES